MQSIMAPSETSPTLLNSGHAVPLYWKRLGSLLLACEDEWCMAYWYLSFNQDLELFVHLLARVCKRALCPVCEVNTESETQ